MGEASIDISKQGRVGRHALPGTLPTSARAPSRPPRSDSTPESTAITAPALAPLYGRSGSRALKAIGSRDARFCKAPNEPPPERQRELCDGGQACDSPAPWRRHRDTLLIRVVTRSTPKIRIEGRPTKFVHEETRWRLADGSLAAERREPGRRV